MSNERVATEITTFKIKIDQQVKEIQELLGPVLKETREADVRAKAHGALWPDRHRLHVLLESAEITSRELPKGIHTPWFLVELEGTLNALQNWRHDPVWDEIQPSLTNPDNFNHTILMLQLALHFRDRMEHKVELVPTGGTASPDLRVQAKGGSQEWVYVECYRPKVLNGEPMELSPEQVGRIVHDSMEKARRQLGEKTGILAVCGQNQSQKNVGLLEKAFQERLAGTTCASFLGSLTLHARRFGY